MQAFHRALEMTWEVVGAANRYVDEQAPWALRKSDPARMATVLYVVLETVRHLAVLTQPVMPDAMASLLDQLGQGEDKRSFGDLGRRGGDGCVRRRRRGVGLERALDLGAPATGDQTRTREPTEHHQRTTQHGPRFYPETAATSADRPPLKRPGRGGEKKARYTMLADHGSWRFQGSRYIKRASGQ